MSAHVIATAGHVDHGKSTLIKALTGIEPDRWDEERRRGLSIGLGYAWASLPSGADVAFVDVPGHERFMTTMLSGVGPVPAVMFVVAADEGWSAQSQEHLEAIDAFGVRHGILVVTKSDRAEPQAVLADASARIARTSLGPVSGLAVSAREGTGLAALKLSLDALVADIDQPDSTAAIRLWIDRSFSIKGAGTVVTGTLGAGRLATNDRLELAPGVLKVTVRGLQSEGRACDVLEPCRRVAVNLRNIDHESIRRGQALITPGSWVATRQVDVRCEAVDGEPSQSIAHIGSAAVSVRIRRLDSHHTRLRLERELPLHVGDRLLLRDPARAHRIIAADIVDVAPVQGRRWSAPSEPPSADLEVRRRGVVTARWLVAAGYRSPPADAIAVGEAWCSREQMERWRTVVRQKVATAGAIPLETVRRDAGIPHTDLLTAVIAGDPQLVADGSDVRLRGSQQPELAEATVALIRRLETRPLDAPDAAELRSLALPARDLSRAVAEGRLVEIARGVVVGPEAVTFAMERLQRLPQPFTVGEARAALGVSRRVTVPLLERLDRLGRTTRISDSDRRIEYPHSE